MPCTKHHGQGQKETCASRAEAGLSPPGAADQPSARDERETFGAFWNTLAQPHRQQPFQAFPGDTGSTGTQREQGTGNESTEPGTRARNREREHGTGNESTEQYGTGNESTEPGTRARNNENTEQHGTGNESTEPGMRTQNNTEPGTRTRNQVPEQHLRNKTGKPRGERGSFPCQSTALTGQQRKSSLCLHLEKKLGRGSEQEMLPAAHRAAERAAAERDISLSGSCVLTLGRMRQRREELLVQDSQPVHSKDFLAKGIIAICWCCRKHAIGFCGVLSTLAPGT
ncbi:hypothetical protein DUI87_25314 [Hirundo rustica rustica]|uniref:Uncharacterized protein n=1 Tax=Hirundo rustica rustica TaxID=333673 RepID=A0A3M0JBX5_HIRRU|nr:hypothetical protein DUI87_25314 [Hirundo rustica rustica]